MNLLIQLVLRVKGKMKQKSKIKTVLWTTMEEFNNFLWKHDDSVAGIGIGIVIVTLIAVIHGVCFTWL